MNQIIRITIGLTVSCLIAAFIMGAVFALTARAKKHNEYVNVQQTMLGLLGYTRANPAPAGLKLYGVYRYIIEDGEAAYLGYMVPVEQDGGKTGYELVIMDLKGRFVDRLKVGISPEAAIEAPEREGALKGVLKPPKTFTYADTTIIARLKERRLAYLLPGEFPGFKTFISVMLALDPNFEILGLEITEHEEDPGLGAEIEEAYFRNQFKEKTFEKIRELKVVKEPLPDDYRLYLETRGRKDGIFSEEAIAQIRAKYRDKDIYAITGATISSKSVMNGVKNMVKKFAYRVERLDRVIVAQQIPVAYVFSDSGERDWQQRQRQTHNSLLTAF